MRKPITDACKQQLPNLGDILRERKGDNDIYVFYNVLNLSKNFTSCLFSVHVIKKLN
jgi:hypothetical protein